MIVVIMGQDNEEYLKMALASVKGADNIIYLDGGSSDNSVAVAKDSDATVLENIYDKEDPKMNGIQRNFYLDYLKLYHPEEWCLVIDADEIVHDFSKITTFIAELEDEQTAVKNALVSVRMRHLIKDLGHEDAVKDKHYVINRLFKIRDELFYPEIEHCVLHSKEKYSKSIQLKTDCTTIWHLAYADLRSIKDRYTQNLKKSTIHTKSYLEQWYRHHLFGTYPTNGVNLTELPEVLLNYYLIDKDEFYFHGRTLQNKHWVDCIQWNDHFKPCNVLFLGCGRGPRVYCMNQLGVDAIGLEKSQWAVDHSYCDKVIQSDVIAGPLDFETSTGKLEIIFEERRETFDEIGFGLIVAYDLFEHLTKKDLTKLIKRLKWRVKGHLLVSVPVLGDPNLELDPTHKIKESRVWWIKQFTDQGFKLEKTPDHFQYKKQLLIFSVGDNDGSN